MENLRERVVDEVKALRPSFLSEKPHFNFITAHYFWIGGLAILGSVILYGTGKGDVAYVDALFFSVGANTQAGLNTIDVSDLNTGQQVVIYVLSMMTNPITINSFVVFLRLYWFERRFQHIVREARLRRRTLSKTKSKGKGVVGGPERGVAGRTITIMHGGQQSRVTNDGIVLDNPSGQGSLKEDILRDEGSAVTGPAAEQGENRNPGIKFASTVKRSDGFQDDATKFPPMRAMRSEEHLAILQRQRQADDEVLRIPGPRDAELGVRPKRVEEADIEEPELLSPTGERKYNVGSDEVAQPQPSEAHRQMTTDNSARPPWEVQQDRDIVSIIRAIFNALSFLKFRKPRLLTDEQRLHHQENQLYVRRHSVSSRERDDGAPYLSWEPTLGRNSAFHDLTDEQREELGGIEYRSLKTLALILTFYFWGFSLLGVVCLLPWILNVNIYGQVVDNVAQSRVWWGIFTPNSAFTDLGFTLTPDSMNSFNTAVFPLLLMSFLIVIGNTGFPVMLRFIIWLSSLFVPRGTGLWEELRFLLDHPRRCFTLLFPSGATWWLFWLLVILNGIDLIFFIILDIGTGPINALPAGIKVLDGLFQATSTRTAGFTCVNLADLHPAVQVSYLIMMYISVFPVAISVRRTNVYEEKSLGIYKQQDSEDDQNAQSDLSYVGVHLRRQLSFDLWYIFVGLFILSISEGSRLMTNDISMFAVLFEIVSAYGTVGMSLGYPTVNASLSSQFSVVGKLVIMAMMVRGRHRGLPYGLDRAILLPSESLNSSDAEAEAEARAAAMMSPMARRNSGVSTGPGVLRRERSRRNSNVLTSFLHVGPPMPAPAPALSRRSTFSTSGEGERAVSKTFPA